MDQHLQYPTIGGIGNDGVAIQNHRVFTQFYQRTVLDPAASREAGRPKHVKAVFVKIQHPGERDTVDRQATEEDVHRFPKEFEAFEKGRGDIPEGTPLAVLFPDNPELVEDLKYFKLHTVEQMAALSDTQMQGVGMGAREWSRKAKAFIETASKGVSLHQHESENRQLREQMAAMQETIAALSAALPEKRGPGRPRKEEGAANHAGE